jgi:hypothetical protein
VTIDLIAVRTIPWSRPQGCPSQFETQTVLTGYDDGDLALEVAVARWKATDSPSRDAFAKLHKDRAGHGINPVVVVAITDDRAWLFGPNPQAAVVGPIAIDHAQRVLQSALNEPSGLDARRNLNQTYEAIAATSSGGADADALRGIGNAGLFATHELRHGVRSRADWEDACVRSKEMMALRKTELIKRLGFSLEDVGGNASLLKSKGENARAVAVILLDNETFDGQSNRFAVSPVAFGLQVADRKEVSWLIVLRKDAIRLYPARLDLGVGRKGLAETYFELNLAVADDSTAGFLALVFSAEALAENGSCYEILKSSSQYAVGLSARLRDNVYGEIVPQLSLAVAAQLPKLGVPMDRDGLNRAYQITLRIFFRMLFQAYADDRKLLPYGENDDYTKNAIKGFAKKLIDEADVAFDDESSSYWDDLIQVWRAIDTGSKRFGIPAYNGGLFSSDEELQPEGALIERLRLTDDIIGPVLRALLIDADDDGTVGPIDFRSLSVREFGTIYEGLLESNLGLADTDLVLDDKDTWIPAPKGAKLVPGRSAKKGTVYFHDTSGARKGTGSYFTPSFVVEHLLERSLDPALDEHLEKVKAVLESGDQVGAADLFFDFKVADLAMGSAHFLTAAIDHIEQRMAGFLDAHPIPGVTNELRRLEEAAKEKLGDNASVPEPSSLLRRQIARRCIYGLDINPVSVELARVSIWIHTFVRGLPMSSLDHTLVCANSLTGIGTVDEALNVLVPGRKSGQITLFDDAIEDALTKARDALVEVAKAAELDSKESKAASRASMKARKDAEEAKLLFDAAVLTRIGRGGLVAGSDAKAIAKLAADPQAQATLEPLQPAHMPLLFPEVFLRDNGGFDVLIGNPPWEEVGVKEHKWWALRFPGIRSLTGPDYKKWLSRIQIDRPDLVAEYEAEVESSDFYRSILCAGPYPGIDTGSVDLYKAFAWRFVQCLRPDGGHLGLVMPRTIFASTGSREWRKNFFTSGQVTSLFPLQNTNGWVFEAVEPRYTVVLLTWRNAVNENHALTPISVNREEFEEYRISASSCIEVSNSDIQRFTEELALPLLLANEDLSVLKAMSLTPPLEAQFVGESRLRVGLSMAKLKKAGAHEGSSASRVDILKGGSFYLWNSVLRSAEYSIARSKVPDVRRKALLDHPVISFRQIARGTDSRTFICCLLPPNTVTTDGAPIVDIGSTGQSNQSFIVGVLSSMIFDWYMRRWVEVNVNQWLLRPAPVPQFDVKDPRSSRIVKVAGRLAAGDDRYAAWAKAVGVPVGSVKTPAEREELEAELDALVAHLYGLTREHVEHIFKTFHRGWDYAPRLTKVLGYFDSIAKAPK